MIDDEPHALSLALPDPLLSNDGTPIVDAATWRAVRRPQLLELFSREVYGRTPCTPVSVRVVERGEHGDALGGLATLRQVRLAVERLDGAVQGGDTRGLAIDVALFLPARASGPVPAFASLNFFGNQAVHADPRIALSRAWMREDAAKGIVDHRATESSRGVESSRWPIEAILHRGYAVVTACYGDIDPDYDDGFANGVHARLDEHREPRPPDAWGAIGAWAWGLSRLLDVIEREAAIDATRVAVAGHSRLGKAALWAAAQDERFALAISNASGCGGASLSKHLSGESVRAINDAFPHWFCRNFRAYDDNEGALPIDQHELIALIAPRPVLVCSAEDDAWADPRGEFLAARAADPVHRLLGTDGLAVDEMPRTGSLVSSTIGYHIRTGGHDINAVDWGAFLDFADRHLRR